MTHRECFLKVLACEPTPWVPNYELGCWGQTVERWWREGMPPGRSRVGSTDMFEGEPLFGLDRRAFARLNTGMIPGFEYEVLAEDEETITARHANGIVTRALKTGTVRDTRMSMDTYLSFPVRDRQSWAELKRRYDPDLPVRYPLWWDEMARAWRGRDYPVCLLGNGSFGLYSQLRSWVGTENLSLLFYDDPALVEEMVEFNTEFLLRLIEPALKDVQFDYFNFFEDCAGKGGPLFGPAQFRRFFLKPYARIIDRLRQAGIRSFWVDSDGDPEVLVPLWMEAGINCFWPLEQASGMDPVRLRRKFGRSLALCGGIDKLEIAKGRDAIRRELESKIPPLFEQGGYIPHLDHTFSPEISYDNAMYYIEMKRRMIEG
ncbi:MAG: Uroporphyrinogen decarboxylase (URO-D) [Lentisphaerae bacterium ADurb.BinA184]|nr:MAG: Uroporphyrinogen decarboxylase (URO-D) [Lentisphaerae bacterium ADurb.BinA184]